MQTIPFKRSYLLLIKIVIIISILLSRITANASQNTNNPFKVENIYVSEKTGNLIDSQTLAISNGSRQALSQLILNLNAGSDRNTIDYCLTKFKDIDKLVEKYSVSSERMTSKSYSAYVTFTFNQQGVESVMNSCGLSYASVSPGMILFVPIVIDKSNYSLVNDEDNPELFKVFSNIDNNSRQLKLKTLYISNLSEMTEFDPKKIAQGTYLEMSKLISQNGCSSALVAIIESITTKNIVLNFKLLTVNEEYHNSLQYQKNPNESQEKFIKRAISSMLQDVDSVWKRGFKDKTENVFSSGVVVEMQKPSDWVKINKILGSIDIIKQYKFKTITGTAVELEIKYLDSPLALSQKLYENGVAIFKKDDKTVMKLLQN